MDIERYINNNVLKRYRIGYYEKKKNYLIYKREENMIIKFFDSILSTKNIIIIQSIFIIFLNFLIKIN